MPRGSSVVLVELIPDLNVGGLQRMVVDLVNHLPAVYDVTLCCFDALGPLNEMVAAGVQVELLKRKPGVDLGFVFRLARFLRRRSTEILHAHNDTAFFYGTLAGKLAGVKRIVYTEHGRIVPMSWKARYAHRFLSRFVYRTIVVAEHLLVVLAGEGFSRDRLRWIPNGVVAGPPIAADETLRMRAALGLSRWQPVIGIVARLDPVKNHAMLLRAMRRVVDAIPEVRLLVVGDGPERHRLEIEAKKLGVSEVVQFVGERTDVPRILAVIDVFVLCSKTEGMSLTLIEAMAAGLPIVATRVGGNASIVDPERSGLLIPSDDDDALAAAILRILLNDELAEFLAQGSREQFAREFTLEQMVGQYCEVLGPVSTDRMS